MACGQPCRVGQKNRVCRAGAFALAIRL